MSNRFADQGVPIADAKLLIAKVGGDQTISFNKAFESGAWILGYAGSFIPEGQLPVMADAGPEESREERLAELLRPMTAMRTASNAAVASLPWMTIVSLLIPLLQKWWENRG